MLAVTASTWVIVLMITFSVVVAEVMDLYFLGVLKALLSSLSASHLQLSLSSLPF